MAVAAVGRPAGTDPASLGIHRIGHARTTRSAITSTLRDTPRAQRTTITTSPSGCRLHAPWSTPGEEKLCTSV